MKLWLRFSAWLFGDICEDILFLCCRSLKHCDCLEGKKSYLLYWFSWVKKNHCLGDSHILPTPSEEVYLWQYVQCERLIYGMINNVIFLEGEVIVGDSKTIFLFCINFMLSDTVLTWYARKLKIILQSWECSLMNSRSVTSLILKHPVIWILEHLNRFKKRW